MLQVYSKDKNLVQRMQSLSETVMLKETSESIDSDVVVITEMNSALELLEKRQNLRLLVLSDLPSFTEGSALLQKGIKGYANTNIHLLHLNQAIEVISSGNIWLYPSFMQELISQSVKKTDERTQILDKLTLREQETALLIAEGKSNKEIAIALEITERTVKAHLTSIYTKTGLTDRLSLAKSLYA